MPKMNWVALAMLCCQPLAAQNRTTPARRATIAEQIAEAVLPLPDSLRAGAGVIGFDQAGRRMLLRPTKNHLVCQRVWPGEQPFDLRCYHEAFLPVVERRLELEAAGRKLGEARELIEAELTKGTLSMATFPTAGYRMLGPLAAYDSTSRTWTRAMERWQSLHVPYLTAATMGLPTDEQRDMPYVMASGTYWAHLMFEHTPR